MAELVYFLILLLILLEMLAYYHITIDTGLRYLEKETATHFSTLAWKIPWTEELGRQQSMGPLRQD